MHYLIVVAVLDGDLDEHTARHDLEISFHGHTHGIEPKLIQHFRNAQRALHSPVLAVHTNSQASIEAHAGSQ